MEYDGFEGAALLFEFAWAPGGGRGTVCCVSFMHLSKQMLHRRREPASRGRKLYRCAAGRCIWVSDISLTNLIHHNNNVVNMKIKNKNGKYIIKYATYLVEFYVSVVPLRAPPGFPGAQ